MYLTGIKFTEHEVEWFTTYVSSLAEEIGLRDWEIKLSNDPPDRQDAIATCNPCPGRKLATLKVCSDFFDHTPEEQRSAMIHELLHCHIDGIDTVAWQAEKVMSTGEWTMFHQAHTDAIEWATDAIAAAVAPLYPLPPEPEAKS